ncbi:hypothetical protein ACJX0J_038537 [Zea mays]
MKVYRAHTPRKNQYNIDVQQGQSELRNLSVVYTWQGHRLAATRENSECILLLPKFLPLNDHENKNLKLLEHKHLRARVQASSISYFNRNIRAIGNQLITSF